MTDDTLLKRTWATPPGIMGWFMDTDHKAIGLRFVITAFVFFLIGGIEALLIRTQLAVPMAEFLGVETYNQMFTMHGTTMMFFFIVPVFEGLGIYLVPLLIGSRETAFPRLNAFAYFIYLIAGITLYVGFLTGQGPNVGWFAYTPLSREEFSPSDGVDFWALSVTLLEFAAISQAITLVVTILKLRAPGMTLARMPIVVWAFLVMSILVLLAMPALVTVSVMLEMDRSLGTHFFNPAQGGDPLLWQHLFWWFGHPDVYIMFLPAFGIAAMVISTFCRREIVGYIFVALAFVVIGLISVTVWAHHMYTTGLPRLSLGFFAAATLMVAIPSAVHVFASLATIWSGRPRFTASFLFAVGFIVIFVFGGLSGVTLGAAAFNFQVHDTHYVLAHFHYIIIGGSVFPLFAGLYYWFPKWTGRMLSEALGLWNFWLTFLGFNLTFLPMHLTGFWGMPRRVYTYQPGMGLEVTNLLSTAGAFLLGVGVLLFLVNVAISIRSGRPAGPNPWHANTLEWSLPSPPEPYNFRHPPSVRSRNPVWMQPELKNQPAGFGDPDHSDEGRVWAELRDDRQETLVTTALEAEPQGRQVFRGESPSPFLTAVAVAVGVVGFLFTPWAVPLGAALAFVAVVFWHWPEPVRTDAVVPDAPPGDKDEFGTPLSRLRLAALPDENTGTAHVSWWGMWAFILVEIVMFGALVFAFIYLSQFEPTWPPAPVEEPDLVLPIVYTLVLLVSSLFMAWGEKGLIAGHNRRLVAGLAIGITLGILFLVLKVAEYVVAVDYQWSTHAYGSISWTISWFHGVHVLSSVLKASVVLVLAAKGYFTPERRIGVQITGLYWHFVVLVWLPLFFVLYFHPRLV